MSKSIIGDSNNEKDIIEKIFNYVQENYRYIAVNIGESGFVPNTPEDIEKNKYGDCKDMTVLNVVLLQAQGIECFPALINTSDRGDIHKDLTSLDFNHMITYVIDKDGNEYWLDATGNSCPLGETSSSIEGMTALVIKNTGRSFFRHVNQSRSQENKIIRSAEMELVKNISVIGKVSLTFQGNYNLFIRSLMKDESQTKMNSIIEKYVKSSSQNLELKNIKYDDLSKIKKDFHISFDFKSDQLGTTSNGFLMFKPHLFSLESELGKYSKKEREYDIELSEPFKIIDNVKLSINPENFSIESLGNNIYVNNKVGRFYLKNENLKNGQIKFSREYTINKKLIPIARYNNFKEIHKAIAKGNEETVLFKIR